MQTIIVHLRPLMPLLVLLCVTLCAGEVAAIPPEAVPPADTQTTRQTPTITVNIAARRLYLYDERAALVKTYPVSVGSSRYRTPIRAQALRTIVWNAWWMPPPSPWAKDDKPTPPGKHNPLGKIKMHLRTSLMIHGTNKPQTIGIEASHGCIRLLTPDAWELARWLQSHSTAPHTEAVFKQYATHRQRSFPVHLEHTIPVDLVYTYVEVIADQLHVHHDIYARIGNKFARIMQTLAEHGHTADGIDQAALRTRLTHAQFRDVVIALADIRRPPPFQQPLASHIVDK